MSAQTNLSNINYSALEYIGALEDFIQSGVRFHILVVEVAVLQGLQVDDHVLLLVDDQVDELRVLVLLEVRVLHVLSLHGGVVEHWLGMLR